MEAGFWIFVGSVTLYSTIPIVAALRPGRLRFILFYAYIAVLLTMSALLGSIYVLPVVGDVELPAGQVAYGGFLFATLVATIVGREVRVIRNVAVLIVAMNTVVYLLFVLSSRAMTTTGVINPYDTSQEVFDQQLRTVVSGGVLSILELLILFQILEAAKARLASRSMLPVYIAAFVGVLVLDGALLDPVVEFPDIDGLGATIWAGVRAKLVLASAFSVPLAVFLIGFRSTIRRFEHTMLEWPVRFFSSDSGLRTSPGWRPRSPTMIRRHAEPSADVAKSLSQLDSTLGVDTILGDLSSILARLPGVREAPATLLVCVDDDVTTTFGPTAPKPPLARTSMPARALEGVTWCDPSRLQADPIAHVPIVVDDETIGLLDVPLTRGDHHEGRHQLESVAMHVTSLLAPCLRGLRERWAIRAPIIELIEQRALDILFQPVVDLVTRRVISVEALSRFHDGTSPTDRFAEAERAGLTPELEMLAFDQALRAANDLPDDVRVAINLSPSVVLDPRLEPLLSNLRRSITIEITEHHVVEDYEALRRCVDRHPRVHLAVDDAGSGYSTLTHVLEMTPDYIKLDRGWVSGIHDDRARQVLVSGLKALADEIDADIIAEGIEMAEEIAALENLGIRFGQGFVLGPPVHAIDISHG